MTIEQSEPSAYDIKRSEQAEQDEFLGRIARSVHGAENDITEKYLPANAVHDLLKVLGYDGKDGVHSISAFENEGILVVREVPLDQPWEPGMQIKTVTEWIYWDNDQPFV